MMSLSERDRDVIWHPYTQHLNSPLPLPIVRGEGALLFDESGKAYIDAIASWWTNIHGHCHPDIAQKVSAQLHTLDHIIFAGFTHEPAVSLVERLLEILPKPIKRIFYSDNGSTAVEVALKMAWQYWQNRQQRKQVIIAFEDAYHGDTFGAMAVGARSLFSKAFNDLLFEVCYIPTPTTPTRQAEAYQQLKLLAEQNNVACFIYEPLVLGAGGMLMYTPDKIEPLLRICKQHQIICIADEVMTGFGRTGTWFASSQIAISPDIICLSKGLAGVMPLAVTACTADIFDAFLSDSPSATLFHGHSFTANPIACSAALASLDLLLTAECAENIARIATQHQIFAQQITQLTNVQNVRTTGSILALDLTTSAPAGYSNSVRHFIAQTALQKGVLLRPLGNVVYILPPYCINNAQLQTIYETIMYIATHLPQ